MDNITKRIRIHEADACVNTAANCLNRARTGTIDNKSMQQLSMALSYVLYAVAELKDLLKDWEGEKPHTFVGRDDRWCELCNRPDRAPIHYMTHEIPVAKEG